MPHLPKKRWVFYFRRFSKKSVWYMIKLAWKSWINRNNDEFFKQDFNYFE